MVSALPSHVPDASSMASSSPSQNTVTVAPSGPLNSVAAALNAAATSSQPLWTVKTSSTSSSAMSLHVTESLPDKSCAGSRLGAQAASKLLSAVACPAHAPIGSDSACNPVAINAGSHFTRPLNSVVVGVVVGVVVAVVVVVVVVIEVVVNEVVVEEIVVVESVVVVEVAEVVVEVSEVVVLVNDVVVLDTVVVGDKVVVVLETVVVEQVQTRQACSLSSGYSATTSRRECLCV